MRHSRPAIGSSRDVAKLRRAVALLNFGPRHTSATLSVRAGAASLAVFGPLAMTSAGAGYPVVAGIYGTGAIVGVLIFVEAVFRRNRIEREEAEYEQYEAHRLKAIEELKQAVAGAVSDDAADDVKEAA